MTLNRIRHLPVVDDGQVVGIVSIGDLVRQVVSTQSEIIQQLQEYISGHSSAQPAP
jgi:CBS domain-containing protein